MNRSRTKAPPRILMVAVGGHIHAMRPLRWARALGYDTLFLDTTGACDPARIPGPSRPFPKVRGVRLLETLTGVGRGRRIAEEIRRRRVARVLARWRPDIVHCHWIGHEAWLLAGLGCPNLVLTAWGSDINWLFEPGRTEESRRESAEALQGCRILVGDAEDVRRKAETVAGRTLNWQPLPLGIATAPFHEAREQGRAHWRGRLGVPPDVFLFGSFRAWSDSYRHDAILEAFARACSQSRIPLGLLFKIYVPEGGVGGMVDEERLRRRAAELGVKDRVWWVRDVAHGDLPALYAATDAIVNYPVCDALPVTFFEAAAARKPVVTSWLPAYDVPLVRDHFRVVREEAGDNLAVAMAGVANEVAEGSWEVRLASAEREVEERYSEPAAISALGRLYAGLPGIHPPPALT